MKSFATALLAGFATATADVSWESLGHFKMTNPAFPTISQYGDSEPFLLCSSFSGSPTGKGHVWVVADVAAAVTEGDVSHLKQVKLDTPNFKWPNDVQVIPDDVFGFRSIIVPDGFLVPGHANGGLYIVKMDASDVTKTESTVKISADLDGYFYHMGHWVDLNKDGRKDFITARSNAKAGGGELVWFEHPEEGLTDATWVEHVVTSGPDVGIQVIEDGPYGKHEIMVFAAEFFNEQVAFYRVSTKDGTLVDSRVIDTEILSAYSVTYTDLNGDGEKELMVNNHEKDDSTNGIWAYKFPRNWMTGDFEKYTLATDFKNAFSVFVPNMAPGFPYPFYPEVATEGKKHVAAHILVAGDGDHTAWLMTPTEPSTFTWDRDTLKETKGTVGALTWADLDNDGWNEVWVPDYDNNKMEVFKMSALPSSVEFLQ
jgi:hypothetical protein